MEVEVAVPPAETTPVMKVLLLLSAGGREILAVLQLQRQWKRKYYYY